NPEVLATLDATARRALLALVRDNPHPISQCLLENLLAAGPVEPLLGEVSETVGFGVELGPWSLGRAGWRGIETDAGTIFARDGEMIARFDFVDTARPDAHTEIDALRAKGFPTFI